MKKLLLFTLTFYQNIISPLLHQLLGIEHGCRHTPTCSAYAKDVIVRYGALKGSVLSLRRVLNCQPFFSL
jgi:putative membrane protein insertion efficiency factor